MNNMYDGWKTAREEQEYLEVCHRKQEFWQNVSLWSIPFSVFLFVLSIVLDRPWDLLILGVMVVDAILYFAIVNRNAKFWGAEAAKAHKALEDGE